MAAPTMDKIAPPIVFLVALLAVFITLTQAMTPTINSNLETDWTPPDETDSPDYLQMFSNATYSWWEPNPYYLDGDVVELTHTYPLGTGNSDRDELFTNALENGHPISFVGVNGHFGELTYNRCEYFFYQHGGWFGMKTWDYLLRYPDDFTAIYANVSDDPEIIAYSATIQLRHAYEVIIGGDEESTSTLDLQIRDWKLNISINHVTGSEASANPWTIVGQFFTFSLPGIPVWLNALIMAPILVMVGLAAYILIRGALPW